MAQGATSDIGHLSRPGDVVTKSNIRLPVWAWGGIGVLVLGVGIWFYRNRKAKSTADTASAQQAATGATGTAQYQAPTTILPIFQGGAGGPVTLSNQQFQDLQAANPPLPFSIYTVTGQGAYTIPQQSGATAAAGKPVTDQWPTGAVISAFKLDPHDTLNISYYATLLTVMNPMITSPYPIGTKLRMPHNGPGIAPNSTAAPDSPQSSTTKAA